MPKPEKPLFIPLKREWFLAFERGEKAEEFRPDVPRWSERVARIGRPVVLSFGYGKQRRLTGVITGHRRGGYELHPALSAIYPHIDRFVAIAIQLDAA